MKNIKREFMNKDALNVKHFVCLFYSYEDYPVPDVLQMIGRANRPLTDQEGKEIFTWTCLIV